MGILGRVLHASLAEKLLQAGYWETVQALLLRSLNIAICCMVDASSSLQDTLGSEIMLLLTGTLRPVVELLQHYAPKHQRQHDKVLEVQKQIQPLITAALVRVQGTISSPPMPRLLYAIGCLHARMRQHDGEVLARALQHVSCGRPEEASAISIRLAQLSQYVSQQDTGLPNLGEPGAFGLQSVSAMLPRASSVESLRSETHAITSCPIFSSDDQFVCTQQNHHLQPHDPRSACGLMPASASLSDQIEGRLWTKVALGEENRHLLLMESAAEGDFLLEYCGEIVPDFRGVINPMIAFGTQWPSTVRLLRFSLQDSSLALDISRRSSIARAAEHSPNPTASLQGCLVKGMPRLIIVAMRNLKPGTPITIDYTEHCLGARDLVDPILAVASRDAQGHAPQKVLHEGAIHKIGTEPARGSVKRHHGDGREVKLFPEGDHPDEMIAVLKKLKRKGVDKRNGPSVGLSREMTSDVWQEMQQRLAARWKIQRSHNPVPPGWNAVFPIQPAASLPSAKRYANQFTPALARRANIGVRGSKKPQARPPAPAAPVDPAAPATERSGEGPSPSSSQPTATPAACCQSQSIEAARPQNHAMHVLQHSGALHSPRVTPRAQDQFPRNVELKKRQENFRQQEAQRLKEAQKLHLLRQQEAQRQQERQLDAMSPYQREIVRQMRLQQEIQQHQMYASYYGGYAYGSYSLGSVHSMGSYYPSWQTSYGSQANSSGYAAQAWPGHATAVQQQGAVQERTAQQQADPQQAAQLQQAPQQAEQPQQVAEQRAEHSTTETQSQMSLGKFQFQPITAINPFSALTVPAAPSPVENAAAAAVVDKGKKPLAPNDSTTSQRRRGPSGIVGATSILTRLVRAHANQSSTTTSSSVEEAEVALKATAQTAAGVAEAMQGAVDFAEQQIADSSHADAKMAGTVHGCHVSPHAGGGTYESGPPSPMESGPPAPASVPIAVPVPRRAC